MKPIYYFVNRGRDGYELCRGRGKNRIGCIYLDDKMTAKFVAQECNDAYRLGIRQRKNRS